MIIKQGLEAEYRQFLEVNSRDGYSFAAVQFMGRWADLMETEMASGAALPDIAAHQPPSRYRPHYRLPVWLCRQCPCPILGAWR